MNYIHKYAELSLAADSYRSAGMPVPFEIQSRIDRLAAMAHQRLTPEQFEQYRDHVEAAKVRILNEEQTQREEADRRKGNDVVKQMTAGMLGQKDGLNYEQLQAAKNGKSIKVRPHFNLLDRKKTDAEVRAATKKLDPRGKGFGREEWERRLEQMAMADYDGLTRIAKSYKASEEQIRAMARDWQQKRGQYEMDKRTAVSKPPKEEVFKPTDDEQRRAAVVDAYIGSVDTDDEGEMDTFFDGVSDDSLEREGMRGDVAKAFVEIEERDNAA